jgi:hypothetical protein
MHHESIQVYSICTSSSPLDVFVPLEYTPCPSRATQLLLCSVLCRCLCSCISFALHALRLLAAILRPPIQSHNLRHNHNPNTPRLPHHTPRHTLQTQSTQPRLAMLNLRNLINMLQTDRANRSLDRIAHSRTTRRRLALLPVVVVHGSWHVSRPSYLVLSRQHTSSGEEQCGGRRGA